MKANYEDLRRQISGLCAGEDDIIAKMATISCEVYHADDRFHWVGFYRNVGNELLKIGPYQGGHGCLLIPFSKGVCGAAARTGEVQLIADVDAFPDHIACSNSTKSELVLPVHNAQNTLIGVFDIDSDLPDAFNQKDAVNLSQILANAFA